MTPPPRTTTPHNYPTTAQVACGQANMELARMLAEALQRLIRVETRLASLMEYEGMTVRSKGKPNGD